MPGGLVTIQYPNTIELAAQYVAAAGAIPTSETAAIKCIGQDVNPETPQSYEASANSQFTLYIKYTQGSGETGIKLKFYDGYKADPGALNSGDWYAEVLESDATNSGVATLYQFEIDLTASATVAYNIPIDALRAFLVTVQSYSGGTPGALTLTLAMRVN